jgi:hypothetical protein
MDKPGHVHKSHNPPPTPPPTPPHCGDLRVQCPCSDTISHSS